MECATKAHQLSVREREGTVRRRLLCVLCTRSSMGVGSRV